VASASAYEEPSLEKSWREFVDHLPIMVVISLVTSLLSGVGILFWILGSGGLVALQQLGGGSFPLSAEQTTALAPLLQLPFAALSGFFGVLITAVPALYYERDRVISIGEGFGELARRPRRYLLAGFLFALVTWIAFLTCFLPGVLLGLVAPIYINLIFTTDRSILDAFQASFQACFDTEQGRSFMLAQALAWLICFTLSICTCLLAALVAGPVLAFYVQNLAYHRGVLR